MLEVNNDKSDYVITCLRYLCDLTGSFSYVTFWQVTFLSADIDQQEMRAVAEKPHDAVVKFDTAALRGPPCDSTALVFHCYP